MESGGVVYLTIELGHDHFGDDQAKADARSVYLFLLVFDAAKQVKQLAFVSITNADSIVDYLNFDMAILQYDFDRNLASSVCKFDCVGKQI